MRLAQLPCLSVLIAAVGFAVAPAVAETVHLSAPESCEATGTFEETANRLEPGDELVLGPGLFCQTGRRLIQVSGTAEKLIIIRGAGAAKTIVTRPGDSTVGYKFNGTEIQGAHLILRGIHFRGGNRGLVFGADSHHITLEDSEISETANNGISLNSGDTHHFIIRRNHIHHTGNFDPARGRTEGEGLYIGCNDAKCIAHSHVIENNLIHDLRATGAGGNDGVEIKYGSYGNIVRNNVIHTIFPALGETKYPCIFAYGTLDANQDQPNIIENNLMWGCGEAIQIVSDAVVRNNTILNSQRALATYYHKQVPIQRNLRIENNTFFQTRLDLEFGRQSETEKNPDAVQKPPPENIVFANNAIYGPGLKPLVTVNLPKGGGVTIVNNAVGDLTTSSLVIENDPHRLIDTKSFTSKGVPSLIVRPITPPLRPDP